MYAGPSSNKLFKVALRRKCYPSLTYGNPPTALSRSNNAISLCLYVYYRKTSVWGRFAP